MRRLERETMSMFLVGGNSDDVNSYMITSVPEPIECVC